MNVSRVKRPSPAFVVAMIALFVALGGTAGAVVSATVPVAKRALVADRAKVATMAENAKKLGGQTSTQIVSRASELPGPASTASGLIVAKSAPWSLGPGAGGNFTVTCDSGQKALGGGWSDPGDYSSSYQSLPTADGAGWTINIWSSHFAPGQQSGTVYAMCLN
jgi:hypothetical protein